MLATIHPVAVVIGLLLWAVALIFVIRAVVDIARRPTSQLSGGSKAGWIIGIVLGWLLVGVIGGVIAAIYLYAVRPRLGLRDGSVGSGQRTAIGST